MKTLAPVPAESAEDFSLEPAPHAPEENRRLRGVAEIPVRISAVLGKKRLSLADVLKLGPGAVIELDRRVGEPIDLYVNDRLVARGELVLVEGALGVTMTEIVKGGER
jgi:flagellar motor switch protein FliN/FliY